MRDESENLHRHQWSKTHLSSLEWISPPEHPDMPGRFTRPETPRIVSLTSCRDGRENHADKSRDGRPGRYLLTGTRGQSGSCLGRSGAQRGRREHTREPCRGAAGWAKPAAARHSPEMPELRHAQAHTVRTQVFRAWLFRRPRRGHGERGRWSGKRMVAVSARRLRLQQRGSREWVAPGYLGCGLFLARALQGSPLDPLLA